VSASQSGRIEAAFSDRLGDFSLDARFSVPATGVTAIFGPSGCGKTTVARCIAGLHRAAKGFCAVNGDVWQDHTAFRPPHRRPVGYVFQEASLFPHLSVRRNLLYGAPRIEAASVSLDEVVDLLGIAPLLDRSPHHLSGGERQRVAIGRALLSQPKLLLMDEPLAALDHAAKGEILPFLERLRDRLSLPVIYISHDLAEIERLADHLVMMDRGVVTATGPLQALPSALAPRLAASQPFRGRNDCAKSRTNFRKPERIKPMPADFAEIDPNRVAAIFYRSQDDVDTLLADFAQTLQREGTRVGGIVQRNLRDENGKKAGMQAIDLMTGREISICQPLGSGAMACKLDASGLADAAVAVSRAIGDDAELIVLNKFSKQEASGHGLRDEFAETIVAGVPLLTAVPEKCFEDWRAFTGDLGTTLLCERQVIEGWWRDLSTRLLRMRGNNPTATFRSSHLTI
jgi:ABC-type sulfate/molybdate transport systems ATPase subunit